MKNLVLVGFMGSGKTTIGKRVANKLSVKFLDMDAEIEKREGMKVSDIFAKEGEMHFRHLERALTEELAAKSSLVIATGGGVVLDPRNIEDFQKTGVVMGLGVHLDSVMARVGHHTHRPLLEGGTEATKRERIEKLLAEREPIYRAAGEYIDTNSYTIDEVVDKVIAIYRNK